MMLYNITKKKKITTNAVMLKNFFSKGIGLMFRNENSVKDKAWIFHFHKDIKVGITMMFMRFPIDIVFLDSKFKVIKLMHGLRPWNNYYPNIKCRYFIELEEGKIRSSGIRENDRLRWNAHNQS